MSPVASQRALPEALAAAAGRTLVLPAEPVHHVVGVPPVAAAQAEVGRASDRHVAHGALEGQTLADGTLGPAGLAATVAAVHAELCRETTRKDTLTRGDTGSCRTVVSGEPTDAFVRFWRAGGELQHVRSLVPQTPAVQDLTITFLKVVKLQRVGRVQQPEQQQEVTSSFEKFELILCDNEKLGPGLI